MSHGKLREDKYCLNCGHFVEEKFCPNCGQENIEPRKPFHYLFTHFIEDFTHYDGQFWGTMKNLLFKPGKLTETYIEGKRQRFVPPVKLYIFISFLTFFLFALFPPFQADFEEKSATENLKNQELFTQKGLMETRKVIDSMKSNKNISFEDSVVIEKLTSIVKDSSSVGAISSSLEMDKEIEESSNIEGYKTRKSFDSAKAANPSIADYIQIPFAHKFFELKEKGAKKGDILKNLAENCLHNLPKALFIYLPIFAFFLWIFHNKKKWWYFDHGVFTLHYFSFLLLTILLSTFLFKATGFFGIKLLNRLIYFVMIASAIYSTIYFFIAHHRVYRTHGKTSVFIGFVLFIINFFAFSILVIGLGLVSFLMIK